MNDQQIFVVMAKTPNIRAVQIADALDQDMAAVSRALRPLVEVGDVVQTKGVAPNGQQAMVYDLSATFKKSREYHDVMVIVNAAAPAVAVPPAPVPGPALAVHAPVPALPAAQPPAAVQPVHPQSTAIEVTPKGSRVARAIAYIAANGTATDAQLRIAMDLPPLAYPATYLANALRTGRISRDGAVWKAGERIPAKRRTAMATAGAPTAALPAITKVNAVDAAPAPGPAATGAAAGSCAAVFRCGLWSDGVLELQRDGSTVAQLAQAEGEHLASFVNRMLRDPLGSSVQTSTHQAG